MLPHQPADALFVDGGGAEGVDQHRDRVGDPDGVGQLHLHPVGEAGGHAVLRHVASHVAGGTVDLRGVLAREGPAAVGGRAAVGVDDDLPAGHTGVAVRPAHHEPPGRVDVDAGLLVEERRGDDRLHDVGQHVFPDAVVADPVAVLAGHHHGIDPHRRVAVVLHRHLRLAVGPQVVDLAFAARPRQPPAQVVGQRYRQRHQRFGLAARIAEHQALVAGPPRVDPHRDVRRLPVDGRQHGAGVGVEPELGAGVPHLADGAPHDVREIGRPVAGDLAGDDHQPRRQQRLAGDAAGRVLGQHRVHDGVRHLIGDLVRVALGDRFRREEILPGPAHSGVLLAVWMIAGVRRRRPPDGGCGRRSPPALKCPRSASGPTVPCGRPLRASEDC